VAFEVVDSLQQLINSGWSLDQALELVSLPSSSPNQTKTKSSADGRPERSRRDNYLVNDIGIVESLESLLHDSEELERSIDLNKQRISGLAAQSVAKETSSGAAKQNTAQVDESRQLVSLFSASFLAHWTNELSKFFDAGVTIAILNSRGKVCHVQYSGWDSAPFRIHSDLLNNACRVIGVRDSISKSTGLFSKEPSKKSNSQGSSDNRDPRNSVCVLLNRLSKNVGHELTAFSQKLSNSKGRVVFFVDSSTLDEERIEKTIQTLEWKNRIHELDAWFLIQRFRWSVRLGSAIDWVLVHPKSILGICGLLLGLLFIPVPYFPSRTCVIEPESRQHIVSRVAGRIASCEVRPGDIVVKDQLLVKLDDEQVLRDLATAEADYQQARKKLEAALANRQQGEASLAKMEILKTESRLMSLRSQLNDLEVRANSAGVVIQGDWKSSVGMPVSLGQNLFEIAELTSMVAELHLHAEDLGQIQVGDLVSIRADSAGTRRFNGSIERIEPRASVSDEGVYFIADASIHDPEQLLRPGMRATARIDAGWRRIGWLLFSRPYRWLSNQWVW
jgi:hypothetical protein